ncbi:MAG: DHH family phosphoesterase, partial [Oscillospiraceae bacterium]|nr:DHH family phosphoesterase [Oscillospiraceae bacterium]
EAALILLLALYTRLAAKKRAGKVLRYMESVMSNMDSQALESLSRSPLPVVIFSPKTREILWSNDRFYAITGEREHFFEVGINDVVPDFTADWLLDGRNESPRPFEIGGRKYKVYGGIFRTGDAAGEGDYLITTYWVDLTEYLDSHEEFLNARPVLALILLDNYDELLKGMNEKDKSFLLSEIDERVAAWTGDRDGFLCKYDRDRYLFLFEERYLDDFIKDKFSVLDTARECAGAGGVHATLSIGIGKDGRTPLENNRFASLALEMALSRGGDQAVIKSKFNFEFFGGHSAEVEKRTKVKSRVMANALGELIADASFVLVMGHKNADFDAVGAAAGICCIARAKGKKAHIVIDRDKNLSENLIAHLLKSPEYSDAFISAQDAMIAADSRTLLVVVDTSRPEEVESVELLFSCTRIAVIDHHRRAVTYIDNATLNFHEPYASSASELVTEVLQYLVEQSAILRAEADALLAGIVLDTKTFAIHTGSRTFDAAAFLRRTGADTIDVKRLMQSDFKTAMSRYELVRSAQIYRDGIALAASDTPETRVIIAQSADELLNIAGVSTSFVAARNDGHIFISGRSIGDVNVQLILEKLGGGGNQSIAGATVKDTDISTAMRALTDAIDRYFEDEQ